GTDTAVDGSYAWVKGTSDLPDDLGVLIKYRFDHPELLTNSEFTEGTEGWHAFDGADVEWDSGSGRGVAVYTPPGTPPDIVQFGRPTASRPAVTPGLLYEASALVRMDWQLDLRLALRWYDASGNVISTDTGPIKSVWGQYEKLTVWAVAPAGAASVSPRVWMLNPPSSAYVLRVDYFRMF